jgi:hypothetical protein
MVALLVVSGARAQTGVPTLAIPPVALEDTAGRKPDAATLEQIAAAVGQALSTRAELALISATPSATSEAPSASAEAQLALSSGRDAYQRFKFDAAATQLQNAVAAVEQRGIPPADLGTLSGALIDLAITKMAVGDAGAASQACASLVTYRPQLKLDPVHVPPNVIALCDAIRAGQRRGTVRFEIDPPNARLFLDGVTATAGSPLSVVASRHYVLILAPDGRSVVKTVDVAASGETQTVQLQLPPSPLASLQQGVNELLRERGPLPRAAAAVVALGLARNAKLVIAFGVEPVDDKRVRLFGASIDVATARVTVNDVAEFPLDHVEATAAASVDSLLRAHKAETQRAGYDFSSALFGQPIPAAVATPAPAPVLTPSPAVETRAPPRKRYIWAWVLGGVLVAAAALTAGLVLGLDDGSVHIHVGR